MSPSAERFREVAGRGIDLESQLEISTATHSNSVVSPQHPWNGNQVGREDDNHDDTKITRITKSRVITKPKILKVGYRYGPERLRMMAINALLHEYWSKLGILSDRLATEEEIGRFQLTYRVTLPSGSSSTSPSSMEL
jgi:hypothetical protein